jgi:hypothetical protein
MEDGGTEWRGTWRGIGEPQPIPELRLEPQGSFARTDLPGLLAVGRCRGNGGILVRAREGADARPPPRFASLALLGREDCPPRREVDGTT